MFVFSFDLLVLQWRKLLWLKKKTELKKVNAVKDLVFADLHVSFCGRPTFVACIADDQLLWPAVGKQKMNERNSKQGNIKFHLK